MREPVTVKKGSEIELKIESLIGFIPGVLATVLGTMLAGLAIYKREMSQLFKELEA